MPLNSIALKDYKEPKEMHIKSRRHHFSSYSSLFYAATLNAKKSPGSMLNFCLLPTSSFVPRNSHLISFLIFVLSAFHFLHDHHLLSAKRSSRAFFFFLFFIITARPSLIITRTWKRRDAMSENIFVKVHSLEILRN